MLFKGSLIKTGFLLVPLFFASAILTALAPIVEKAQAAPVVNIHLQVTGIEGEDVFNGPVKVEDGAPSALHALEQALDKAAIPYTILETDWGPYLHSINNEEAGYFGHWDGWLYAVTRGGELIFPMVGAADFILEEGDRLLFYYGRAAEISSSTVIVEGMKNPVIEINLVGDEFSAGAEDAGNWELLFEGTGLAPVSITLADNQTVFLELQGKAGAGSLHMKAGAGALGGEEGSNTLKIVTGVAWSALEEAIFIAENLLDESVDGHEAGRYPPAARRELARVLAEAQQVLEMDEVTQGIIDETRDKLAEATAWFKASIITEQVFPPGVIDDLAAKTAAFYSKGEGGLGSWWELVALHGAGVDLRVPSWQPPLWTGEELTEGEGSAKYAGIIMGLLALGKNPAGVWERDLTAELADRQQPDGSFGDYINDTIWAVIALQAAEASFDEERAVEYLLEQQLSRGGFAFYGDAGDPDLTGMALVALSGYRTLPGVNHAVNKALVYLESVQLISGGFADAWDNRENANTIATVISGLVAAGENIFSERWAKDATILDALLRYQLEDGSFSYQEASLKGSEMSTAQALIALGDLAAGSPAYFRLGYEGEIGPAEELPETAASGWLIFFWSGSVVMAVILFSRLRKKLSC